MAHRHSPPLRRSPRRLTLPSMNYEGMVPDNIHDESCESAENVRRRLIISQPQPELEMTDIIDEDMGKVFTFLSRQTRGVLRNVGKKWNRRGTGNKKELLYRNILFLLDGKRSGRNAQLMLKENEACPSLEEFLSRAEESGISFEECPSEETIRNHLQAFGDPQEHPTHRASKASGSEVEPNNRNSPPFSISEFARLFILLRDDHVCREALFRLTQELKRADFEAGRTRDTFWKQIETRFNDKSLKPTQSFEGSVPEANPSAEPLCHRTFDVLKTHLQNSRKAFTLAYANFSQSGQNDPEKWSEFLTKDRNGEFVAASKRCYIIFVSCRLMDQCGQDMFLLNASLKTFAGGDEGPEEGSSGSSGSKRKRMSSDAFSEKMDKRWSGLSTFMENTTKIGESIQQRNLSAQRSELDDDFALIAQKSKAIKLVRNAHKEYLSAIKNCEDPEIIEFLKENYDTAKEKYSSFRAKANRGASSSS